MFREFLRLLFSLVRSPLLLGVALLGVIVNLAILALMSGAVFTIIADLVYGPALAGDWTSLIAWSGIYAVELMIITLGLFAVLVVNAGVGLAFGRFAALQQERKTQVLGATGYALGKTGLLVAWGVFMGMLALAGVVLLGVVFALGALHEIVFGVLLVAWLVGAVLIGLVTGLAVPVMGIEDIGIKEGLRKSAEFVRMHLWKFILFMAILAIVLLVIREIGSRASDAVDDDTISFVIAALFLLVSVVCSNLAVPFFYITERQKHR
jgi:magnesium-transporting ATPase (P-type)